MERNYWRETKKLDTDLVSNFLTMKEELRLIENTNGGENSERTMENIGIWTEEMISRIFQSLME